MPAAVPRRLADDAAQEAALAALDGADPDAAVRRLVYRERKAGTPSGKMDGLPDAGPRIAGRGPSPGKRRKLRRDAVILAAYRAGISQRVIADVFGLARSTVAEIVERTECLAT